MTTLPDLTTLLTRCPADSPAILRLPESERDVGGLAKAYLPWRIALGGDHPEADGWPLVAVLRRSEDNGRYATALRCKALDLRDPGTAHAVVVALALALGLDPGVGGVACMWVRDEPGWSVVVERGDMRFTDPLAIRQRGNPTQITACLVAREPDPIKALVLAVRHVLEAP